MAWEINRFKVKPSGVFANWRGVIIYTDENGNITYGDWPGEPSINLDCLSDYKKNDRGIWAGQKITEYCNLDTHTNYRVYAQDCRPWAYVQTDLNAAKCGYLEPLPEPAVPPNPFGTASYGLYKTFNFCDDNNTPVSIKIFKRGYNGVSSAIDSAGSNPVILSYKNTEDYKLSPIRGMEVNITFTCNVDFEHQQFYTVDEREFRVEVTKNGKLKFKGFIVPSDAQEEFTAPPYDVTINATDGLGALKKVTYPIPAGSSIDIKQNFVQILAYCLANTNLDLDIATACNLYAAGMANGIDNDPLWQATANPLRMNEGGVVYDCYKALEAVCRTFGAFLVQDNGMWNFVRQSELSNQVIRRRIYNYKGLFLRSEQFYNLRSATCNGDDISILDENPLLRIGTSYKRAEVKLEFGEVPSIVYNGDFELWDGQNFNYWTRYGGIKVSQVERKIKTASGSFGTGNFAMQFDEKQQNGKYIQASPIYVNKGDKLTISYNVSNTPDTQVQVYPRPAYQFIFRIKIGEYYLANKGDSFEWIKELTTSTNFVENSKGNIETYTMSFDVPEIPIDPDNDDYLIIQLFGFQKIVQSSTVNSGGVRPGSGNTAGGVSYIPAPDYNPIHIDNFSIKKSKAESNSEITSVLYLSEQDDYYTKTPDVTSIIYGDYFEQVSVNAAGVVTGTRPSRANGDPQNLGDIGALYAITFNGEYTSGWYEYGVTSSTLPIGLMLAKSIMKAYQAPFRFLSSTFLGDDISYLDVFNVSLPNNESFGQRTFALLSGDINLKTNEITNAEYVEIFEKPAKTIDVSTPGYPGSSFPPIVQNPNPPAKVTGIFTEQFTQEFT